MRRRDERCASCCGWSSRRWRSCARRSRAIRADGERASSASLWPPHVWALIEVNVQSTTPWRTQMDSHPVRPDAEGAGSFPSQLAPLARLPQALLAVARGAGEDEEQVREPVEV